MSTTLTAPPAASRRVPMARGYRFELVKLVSQWRIRLVVLACCLFAMWGAAPLMRIIGVTGTNVANFAPIVTPAADQRKAVSLTLQSGNILLGTGSTIAADAKANINLTVNDANGGLMMLGSIVDHGGALTVQAPYVWLGSQADIDLSGTFIANSTFGQTSGVSQSGTLLAGGTALLLMPFAGGALNVGRLAVPMLAVAVVGLLRRQAPAHRVLSRGAAAPPTLRPRCPAGGRNAAAGGRCAAGASA